MVAISLMLGASSSFMSPYGYQTNLMVFNAGDLKALDLVKMGAPLTVSINKTPCSDFLFPSLSRGVLFWKGWERIGSI